MKLYYGFATKKEIASQKNFFSNATPTASKTADVYVMNARLPNKQWIADVASELGYAEGYGTLAYGRASHSEGERTYAIGSLSHAEGYDTTAIGHGSRVNGVHSFADGKYSTASGKCVNAKGDYSIAMGYCATSKDAKSFTWSGIALNCIPVTRRWFIQHKSGKLAKWILHQWKQFH